MPESRVGEMWAAAGYPRSLLAHPGWALGPVDRVRGGGCPLKPADTPSPDAPISTVHTPTKDNTQEYGGKLLVPPLPPTPAFSSRSTYTLPPFTGCSGWPTIARQANRSHSMILPSEISPGLLGSQTRQFDKLIEQCNVELTSVFGMELVELRARGYNPGEVVLQNELKRQSQKNSQAPRDGEDEDLPTKSNKGKASTKQYVLRSSLDPSLIKKIAQIVDDEIPENDANEEDWNQPNDAILDWKHGDELAHLGILGFILALILMHGRSIENAQLLNYLKRLKIGDNWQPPSTRSCAHPPGTLGSLLNQFSKQGYLECAQKGSKAGRSGASQAAIRRQSQNHGAGETNQEMEWRWGARSEIEFGEVQIAEFMSDIYRSATGRVADQSHPEQRRQVRHEKLMSDIAKSAGSALQDSSQLPVPGISKGAPS
ncbi:hypothetical protein PCASD_25340 [Puccinia coronata f. sp. avenae]|uniref:MAGE domain-containing protein n=1 Tax=Puccinia coronata f. sp. avenae TaxID=200324 RepID=A0A2N5RW51_9BASI|nr:hypothetical protein PCASD_25340 [Puccinia coronata f. sp. avenae]